MNYGKIEKPFDSYSWKWASRASTEKLNHPAVYLGCLRVLCDNVGKKPSDIEVHTALKRVDQDLADILRPPKEKPLHLARSQDRNVFRNSQQYWKSFGLLLNTRPAIVVSNFAKDYAKGKVTQAEFASYIVKTLELPNSNLVNEAEVLEWDNSKVKIKPLELICQVLQSLYLSSIEHGYLTPIEMVNVVIPMAGNLFSHQDIAQGVIAYRKDPSSFSKAWSADEDKEELRDRRNAGQFLLFLYYYGFVSFRQSRKEGKDITKWNDEFFIDSDGYAILNSLIEIKIDYSQLDSSSQAMQIRVDSEVEQLIRNKKTVTVTARPNQTKFRASVLKSGDNTCVISGCRLPDALHACHIIEVQNYGSDDASNGLLLRRDLHDLYDKGHIKILENGNVVKSEIFKLDPEYANSIPDKIIIPDYININALRVRNKYQE